MSSQNLSTNKPLAGTTMFAITLATACLNLHFALLCCETIWKNPVQPTFQTQE